MMMENNAASKQIPAINTVEGFEPSAFTRQITNDDGTMSLYLDVKFRMLWFRLRYPDGKLDTEIQSVSDQSAVVCCKVFTNKADAADQYIAKSMAQRFMSQEKFGDRFLEIAETAAIGRALAAAGFGTQFCSNAEVPNFLTDSPVDRSLLTGDEENNGAAASVVVHETHPAAAGMEHAVVMAAMPAQQPAPQMQVPAQMPFNAPQQAPVAQGYPNAPAPSYQPAAPAQPKQAPVQQVPGGMTLDDAKNVVVDFGKYKGSTLGQIAMVNPGDLQWYAERYVGANKALKEGATMLVNAARKMAG